MNEEAKTKITRARIAMIMKQPFFGTLALRLQVEEKLDLKYKTLATNGKKMFYDPDWVLENDFQVVQAGIAHEVGHCIFDTIARRNGRTPNRWNQASDFVINAVLKDSGFTLGADWLYSPVYTNMTSDQVYAALPPDVDGGGNGQGDPFDQAADELAPGVDPQMNADDWQIAAIQAATIASQHDTMPGSLKRFIQEIVTPKADWRSVLRRFMTETSKEDYSYAHLNRKFAALGIYLPGLYSESMGEMITCIDTSGSISNEILNAFGAEISEIAAQMRPTVLRNIYCDADVNHVDEFEQGDEPTFAPYGGGGTDFRPPFELVEEKAWQPKCFAYLTDGYGPFPAKAPDYPVLWLMTTDVQPPWGEVVRIEL